MHPVTKACKRRALGTWVPGCLSVARPYPDTHHQPRSPRPNTHEATPNLNRREAGAAHIHPHTPNPGKGRKKADGNSNPNMYQTQTPSQEKSGGDERQNQERVPHNSRKPRVNSPDTEAARVMQVTRPNEIRSPGVRLHPKASAALGLGADVPPLPPGRGLRFMTGCG